MILIDEHIDRIDISSSLELLPPERREKALAYRDELQQRQCIGAWLLLRKACSEVFGLNEVPPVAVGQHGKPYFPAMPRLHFNVSHCRVAVACAADHVPVGIDIECPRNFSDNLLSYVLISTLILLSYHTPKKPQTKPIYLQYTHNML